MSPRFKTLYGKPKTLTDFWEECGDELIAGLLAKPEAELNWRDFKILFCVGIATASYEEGLYYLPDALAFLRRNPNGAGMNCVNDVMWFLSEHAARLAEDELLPDCREQVFTLLRERTEQFQVTHWDREKNRQMGYDREHYDYLEDSQLVWQTLETLFQFKSLGDWAGEFLSALSQAEKELLKSAWFLELSATWPELHRLWAEFEQRGSDHDCPVHLAPDQALLERHARVIRNSGELFTRHPTYWNGLFGKLGLSAPESPSQTSSAAAAGTSETQPDWKARREQLIRDIEAAFRDVQRGQGLTLHEAVAFEGTDHCSAEERARARVLDPETRWQDIPDSSLEECLDRWAFDDEGFRFHLPAYLRWYLRHPRGQPPACGVSLFLQLSVTGHKPKDRLRCECSFDRFTPEQKRVIARFLEFRALEVHEHGPTASATEQDAQAADLAERAWQSYWFKFSQ
jgi:hypothetical protein